MTKNITTRNAKVTAEIAIANKSAIALAADSAVSFGDANSPKIYHTVNKITMLSKYHPVGVMVYGGADFMNVPIETIAKMYREDRGAKAEEKCFDYISDFLGYASRPLFSPEDEQHNQLLRLVTEELNRIRARSFFKIQQNIIIKGSHSKRGVNRYFEQVIDTMEAALERTSDVSPEIISKTKLNLTYGSAIDEISEITLTPFDVTKKVKQKIRNLIWKTINKHTYSGASTGFVIAGFGSEEIFPSLVEVQTDGILNGRLKFRINKVKDVGREHNDNEVGAFMIPFAQHEMVERFMNGVDSEYNRKFERKAASAMRSLGKNIVDQTVDSPDRPNWNRVVDDTVNEWLDDFREEMARFKRDVFWHPIIEVVQHLPKEELANLAESLVNLTSIKRRVSNEAETVGGPIDVAVISRGDGFVWIKRKHYFDPNLNPHFFSNYMNRHRRGDSNEQ